MRRNVCFAAIMLLTLPSLLTAQTPEEEAPDLSYMTVPFLYYEYGNRGPSKWSELDSANEVCAAGVQQSPINIAGNAVTVNTRLLPLEFHYSAVAASDYQILNRQRALYLSFTTSPGYMIDKNGETEQRYNVRQLHFHYPSEHGIAGGRYPLEMHIVHDADDEDNEIRNAVVGIFFQIGNNNEKLNAIWRNLPWSPLRNFEHYLNASYEFLPNSTNPEGAWEMPIPGTAFYTYPGSFTIPPCTESVKWFVMRDTAFVSSAQIEAFKAATMVEEEKTYVESLGVTIERFMDYGGSRPFQPVNERVVEMFPGVGVYDDDASVMHMAVAGLVTSVATLIILLVLGWWALSRSLGAPKDPSILESRSAYGTDSRSGRMP